MSGENPTKTQTWPKRNRGTGEVYKTGRRHRLGRRGIGELGRFTDFVYGSLPRNSTQFTCFATVRSVSSYLLSSSLVLQRPNRSVLGSGILADDAAGEWWLALLPHRPVLFQLHLLLTLLQKSASDRSQSYEADDCQTNCRWFGDRGDRTTRWGVGNQEKPAVIDIEIPPSADDASIADQLGKSKVPTAVARDLFVEINRIAVLPQISVFILEASPFSAVLTEPAISPWSLMS